jgi:hypothetical protein
MSKFRIGLTIVAIGFIIYRMFYVDFSDLSWENNTDEYKGILSMFFLIAAMIASSLYEKSRTK